MEDTTAPASAGRAALDALADARHNLVRFRAIAARMPLRQSR